MKKTAFVALMLLIISLTVQATIINDKPGGDYKQVVQGFDWGPAVNKVILSLGDTTSSANGADYLVLASRKSNVTEIAKEQASGQRNVVFAYVSDEGGNRAKTGKYVTLVLQVGPGLPIGSPIQYTRGKGNQWVDYTMTIVNNKTQQVWDNAVGKIMVLIDDFNLTGKYKHSDKLTMSYASYTPKTNRDKSPLIIWLHGGGEGGTDPTIPLLANLAANYASPEIQSIFEGAYVLVPQCPGAWMHNGQGVTTHGKENDIYNEGLMALIKEYVKANPKVDPNRIYVGGCSNGGYMALKLMLLYPDYFAAAYISSLAYQSQYISDDALGKIKKLPIWFVHSKDDGTTKPDETVIPVYKRLISAGAKNVHLTLYDHVYDVTDFFGGKDYIYNGHLSWIYVHKNLPRQDFDGSPVKVNGKPVSIMEWLAAQKK
ncbi:MAG: PHB depolymerase family esterase [Chryseolinea sp.]